MTDDTVPESSVSFTALTSFEQQYLRFVRQTERITLVQKQLICTKEFQPSETRIVVKEVIKRERRE